MPPDQPPYVGVEIDERWMPEWLEHGFEEFTSYLTRQANFDRWLTANNRKEPTDGQ